MALEWTTVSMLDGKSLFPQGIRVLDIGSSNVYNAEDLGIEAFIRARVSDAPASTGTVSADIGQRSRIMKDGQQQNKAFLGEILTAAGLHYESIDIADGYRTTQLDLNRDALPRQFAQAFDLVMNVGTSEHVLDQAAVFRIAHEATRPSGLMFHQLPASGFSNHGYFCYTPRLFCDLAGYNHYEIVDLWFDGPGAQDNLLGAVEAYRHLYPALDALLARSKTNERDVAIARTRVPDMSINVLFKRTSGAPFLGVLETSTSVGRIAPATFAPYSANVVDRMQRRLRAPIERRFPEVVRWLRRALTGRT